MIALALALLWHVLYVDLWGPVWPNLAASVIWAVPAFVWHHRAIKRHITQQHEQTVNMLAEKVSGNG